MTRTEWLQQFEDELKKLRPHLSGKVAYTIALQQFNDKEHPRDLARQYDKRLRPPAPATATPASKRPKK